MRAFTAPILVATLTLALLPGVTLGLRLPPPYTLTTTGPTIVTIYSTGANPQIVDVAAGTPIQWRNRDTIPHTVTADDGSFAPIHMQDGDSSALILLPAGVYPYHIDKVSSGAGTVVVHETSTSPTATPSPVSASSPAGSTPTPVATNTTAPMNTPMATATNTTQLPAPTASPAPTNTDTPFETVPVTIAGSALEPVIVTVTAGMGVRWTNLRTFPVTVTQDGGFVLGPIPPGGSAARLFAQVGRQPYYVQGIGAAGLVVVRQVGADPTVTVAATAAPTTVTAGSTATATVGSTATATDSPGMTPTATANPSLTSTPTMRAPTETSVTTPAPTATAPEAPSPTMTATPTSTMTNTVEPAAASATADTATSTAVVQTNTTVPTATATDTATATPSPTGTGATPMDIVPVTITHGAFDPQTVEVAVNGYVRWINLEPISVTVRRFGGFTVGPIAPQSSARYQFTQEDRIQYSSPEISAAGLVIVGQRSSDPTATPLGTPVASASATVFPAPTATSPPTTTGAPTHTPTATPSPSATPTRADTPTAMVSPTLLSPTMTPSPTAPPPVTPTSTPTATPTLSRTPTAAPASPTAQGATAPTPTDTTQPLVVLSTATDTPSPLATPTANPPPTLALQDNAVSSPAVPPASPTPTIAPSASRPLPTRQATASTTTGTAPPTRPASGPSNVTPHPIPPPSTPGHALVPGHSPPPLPSPKHGATGHSSGTATVVLAASGQVWQGRTRVDLTISVGLRAGRALGGLRIHDARARLIFTSLRIDQFRSTRHGMLVSGMARANRRTVPFALDLETVGRTTTVTVTVGPLGYHLSGAFHGRLLLRKPHAIGEPRVAPLSRPPAERGKGKVGRRPAPRRA